MYNEKGIVKKKEELINKHAQLVKRIAFQLKSRLPASVEMDDLIQAGMIGLMDAVNRYEDTHGAQFETYATQRIRGSMLDELRGSDHLPRGLRKNMRDIELAISRLEQKLGRPPVDNEIAKEINLSVAEYQEVLGDCHGHQIFYYEDYDDTESGGEHFLDKHTKDNNGDPINGMLANGFKASLVEAINALPEREKILMGLYYEQEFNFKEIGAVLEISESRVCQLHTLAVARIRSSMKENLWTGAV